MAKSTHRITYRYETPEGTIEVSRVHVGTAYARNGNVHNPTEYFIWEARINGELASSHCPSRAAAYEYARGFAYYDNEGKIYPRKGRTVRHYIEVQDEMQANYRGRVFTEDVLSR